MKKLAILTSLLFVCGVSSFANDAIALPCGENADGIAADRTENLPVGESVPEIVPGMKYRQIKKLYDSREYSKEQADRYSPAGSGVASFFIPGLGQWICGEVGRGFAWFGGGLASVAVMGVGEAITLVGIFPAAAGDASIVNAGLITTLAGLVSLVVIDACSCADAVKVAKVKNMYNQDLRRSGQVSFELHPALDFVRTPGGTMKPTAGLTLAVKF